MHVWMNMSKVGFVSISWTNVMSGGIQREESLCGGPRGKVLSLQNKTPTFHKNVNVKGSLSIFS